MRLRLNKAHFPVTSLGPGRRIGYWFQGCTIGCVGCISRDTWDAEAVEETSVEAAIEWARQVGSEGFDGVTLSGGEPFEQPQALAALLDSFIAWRRAEGLDFDLLAYSGMPLKTLRRRYPEIVERLDAVIAEPFVARMAPGDPGMGSANQSLTTLTPRGKAVHCRPEVARPSIQVSVDAGAIWCIGVPRPGDLERVEIMARRRGVQWRSASWRA